MALETCTLFLLDENWAIFEVVFDQTNVGLSCLVRRPNLDGVLCVAWSEFASGVAEAKFMVEIGLHVTQADLVL